MPIDALVADANPLLSAVIGKAALRVFTDFPIALHTTEFNATEVETYLPELAEQYRLPLTIVRMQ